MQFENIYSITIDVIIGADLKDLLKDIAILRKLFNCNIDFNFNGTKFYIDYKYKGKLNLPKNWNRQTTIRFM